MCRPGVGIGIGLLEAQHLLLTHPASSAEAAAHPTVYAHFLLLMLFVMYLGHLMYMWHTIHSKHVEVRGSLCGGLLSFHL